MCLLSSLSLQSKTFHSGNLTWPEFAMFQLENTLSRKHSLFFPSVNKSLRVISVFFQGSTPFTCRALLCSFNLGGGKTVPCDLGTVNCFKQLLALELEEENNQKVSLEKALKLFSRANYCGG